MKLYHAFNVRCVAQIPQTDNSVFLASTACKSVILDRPYKPLMNRRINR